MVLSTLAHTRLLDYALSTVSAIGPGAQNLYVKSTTTMDLIL